MDQRTSQRLRAKRTSVNPKAMRKLIVSMNITLDGFMAGPECELDWHFSRWNNEMAELASRQLSEADTIMLGAITYKAMASYWPMQATNMAYPRNDVPFADMMNSYTKIVFSDSIKHSYWNNSIILNGTMSDEVKRLKSEPGKDMIIYGSGQMIASLQPLDLIDEYHLWIHPVILGKGKPLFRDPNHTLTLELFKTHTFKTGVIVLYYRRNH